MKLLDPEIQSFINSNIGADTAVMALSNNPFEGIDFKEILQQIAAKTKAEKKLPLWFATKNILYPSKVSVEQTSSEITAAYKASLVFGDSLIDLSGGFGVDDYYFSKSFLRVVHCELQENLSEIVAHNFEALNATNIDCKFGESTQILKELNQSWDCIYVDPSRRNDAKGKVFMLSDCSPDVAEHLPLYLSHAKKVLIKAAPILDISAAMQELYDVKEIHLVAVNNEMKEILFLIEKGFRDEPKLICINFTKVETEKTEFDFNQEFSLNTALPKQFLYEPNAAVMKSGQFNQLSSQVDLPKLHQHSHLYTSEIQIKFPGRSFKIDGVLDYNKAGIARITSLKKANITTRNFPLSVEELRKKMKLKDGGNSYCFFTTNMNNEKIILICSKIPPL